ncbi:MAG TPA: ornithine carbamoyltransferase [Myxococcota bacterium]|nr:ornithine carbamoyltransferase [Myxococcota bacterium]HRY94149.1 ornithine carbamoyltransferase [Myxococcota bacterium]HSA21882.1 ornithine carbamoyltransferase [Myxococcota bacterium]
MTVSLKGKSLVSLGDLSREEFFQILDTADELKRKHKRSEPFTPFVGKNLALIFQKPSLRTRVSFEAGMTRYGGHGIYLGPTDIQLGARETTADIARTLSRYCDAIMARTFGHDIVLELAKHATVPVVNGLTDLEHPCQILADLMTVREKLGRLEGLKLTFLGDGNNVAHSLLQGCALAGMHMTVAVPRGFEPNADILARAREVGKRHGSRLEVSHDIGKALKGADVLYTDVWASMGQEAEKERKAKAMRPLQLNAQALAKANRDAIVLHCLPAHRGEEITDEVIEGPQSVVFDEAENRLHAQMAVLVMVIR